MYASLMATAILSHLAGLPAQGATQVDQCWTLDKTTVMSGGCVALVLNDTCSGLRGLKLQIDDRDPVSALSGAGITIQQHRAPGGVTTTFILLSHFLENMGLELVSDEPETYRMKPVFDEPGTVRLTLSAGDESLGTKVVTVVPATRAAQGAVELLFPTVMKDQGAIRNWAKCMGLLMHVSGSGTIGRFAGDLPQFKQELEILSKHPDWAEIFRLLVVGLEANIELSDLIDEIRAGRIEVGPDSEPPPTAPTTAKALATNPKSPFAKAIQDGIRQTVGLRKFYLRNPELLRSDGQ